MTKNSFLQVQQLIPLRKATKASAPLIHCITNPISIHDCANVILAVGARPIMAEHPKEVAEITASASALMLNLGNITDARIESMQYALEEANRGNIPVLLDLVGVTCSSLRCELARKLLSIGEFAVVKGNISEILAAADLPFHGTGIDAGLQDALSEKNEIRYGEMARSLAAQLDCTVLATGKQDLIADRHACYLISNGDAALSGITGSGCMVGAMTAAYLPASVTCAMQQAGNRVSCREIPFYSPGTQAALLAVISMGIAGEHAADVSKGPGSFQAALLDELFCMTDQEIQNEAQIRFVDLT